MLDSMTPLRQVAASLALIQRALTRALSIRLTAMPMGIIIRTGLSIPTGAMRSM